MFELLMRPFNLHLKETEDDGWWEGELNGHCGFFPDNFVMLIPPMHAQQVSGLKHNLKNILSGPHSRLDNCLALS